MPRRFQYVADRVNARMQNRGETMVVRHVSLLSGAAPFKNPPDVSSDLAVTAGSLTGGQNYIGLAGATIIGRLQVGDGLLLLSGSTSVSVTVQAMPATVLTDADGIPQVDGSGHPVFGSPIAYNADALAWDNALPVVPVSPPVVAGTSTPVDVSTLPDAAVTDLIFQADDAVHGVPLPRSRMVAMGWIEVDRIGISFGSAGLLSEPKINDLVLLNGGTEKRSIVALNPLNRGGIDLLYQAQLL
jgi:hypothetical protein